MRPDDADLFQRCLEGNPSAFEALMRRHFRAAYAVAIAITRDPADAEDVCQDAFVRCWERRSQCRHPDRFRAWLMTIVRSVAHNHLARERIRRGEPLRPDAQHSGERSPQQHVEVADLREALLQAMDVLTEPQRMVLVLSDLEGWRHREIAEKLEMSETMSRRHLSDARKRMRSVLDGLKRDWIDS